MADVDPELDTGTVLEQGDALLRSSRDLLAQLNRQLDGQGVDEPGDNLRIDGASPGDS